MKFISDIIDFLAPKLCPGCGRTVLSEGEEMCAECLAECDVLPEKRCPRCGGPADGLLDECGLCQLEEEDRPWKQAVSVFPFAGKARQWIHEFKYRDKLYLAPFLADSLADAWRKYGNSEKIDGIVPVPLHWLRRFMRGYNQTEVLADHLGRRLGLPTVCCLKRSRYTRQQARMNKEERRRNIRHAFVCRKSPAGLRLLLLDDVFTTGSTLKAAATALLDGGAAAVSVLTIARDL
ncbi:MAG: ComF family protein [Victivallales bacterium]|nr:ComF family protein [Victivallales bacterium]